jgi:hypothetical protein
MALENSILILTTGGTIDKQYFDSLSHYQITDTTVTKLLDVGRVTHSYEVKELLRKDSIELTNDDRAWVVAHVRRKSVLGIITALPALFASCPSQGDSLSPIDPARMSAIVKTLASDASQGRAPGTPGEATTVAYLVDQFRALGLRPAGENGSWLQKVPLVHNIAGVPPLLEVRIDESILPLVVGRDISMTYSLAETPAPTASALRAYPSTGLTSPASPSSPSRPERSIVIPRRRPCFGLPKSILVRRTSEVVHRRPAASTYVGGSK